MAFNFSDLDHEYPPWLKLQDVRDLTDQNVLIAIDDGPHFRKHLLILRCDYHNELMSDVHVFKHLRRCNSTAPGGKLKKNQRVSFDPISIHLTGSNIRELIFRHMRMQFSLMISKFNHSLHIFAANKPVLQSCRVAFAQITKVHKLVAEIPNFDEKVRLQDLPFGRSLIEVEGATADVESAVLTELGERRSSELEGAVANYNMAIYTADEFSGMTIDGTEYSMESVLGKVRSVHG